MTMSVATSRAMLHPTSFALLEIQSGHIWAVCFEGSQCPEVGPYGSLGLPLRKLLSSPKLLWSTCWVIHFQRFLYLYFMSVMLWLGDTGAKLRSKCRRLSCRLASKSRTRDAGTSQDRMQNTYGSYFAAINTFAQVLWGMILKLSTGSSEEAS